MNRPDAGADAVVEAAIAGVSRGKRHGYRLRPSEDRCRALPGEAARVRRRTPSRDRLGFAAERPVRCGDDESGALLHDVSRYGGGAVPPSKISMMIICP